MPKNRTCLKTTGYSGGEFYQQIEKQRRLIEINKYMKRAMEAAAFARADVYWRIGA